VAPRVGDGVLELVPIGQSGSVGLPNTGARSHQCRRAPGLTGPSIAAGRPATVKVSLKNNPEVSDGLCKT
jgi:hypothetical protein